MTGAVNTILPFTNSELPLVNYDLMVRCKTQRLALVVMKVCILNYDWRLKRLGRFAAFFFTLFVKNDDSILPN